MTNKKKVFVSGCFDLLHSGHIAFLEEVSKYGLVYVALGSDDTIYDLKGKYPVNNQTERKYMLEAIRFVEKCFVNKGSGILDFKEELKEIRPDLLIVNEEGNTRLKSDLCKEYGIEYKVLKRIPHGGLPIRSTTQLRTECNIPFRIDLAGGWLDQPFVSKYYSGSVITISIEPTIDFNERSGMASSTRRNAVELWKTEIPSGNQEKLAKMLFSYENPPGTNVIAGSQDALGIVLTGLNKLDYDNNYWPYKIESKLDEELLRWIEDHLYLVSLGPRESSYDVLEKTNINVETVKSLSDAASACWEAILNRNISDFGRYFTKSFEAQTALFPNMLTPDIENFLIDFKNNSYGYKLSGAGGGGYLIIVSDEKIENSIKIKIRRKSF